jgi:hypothetical protein
MRRQKGEFEKENLKLHLCNAVFEAYSASYLTTKHHMLSGTTTKAIDRHPLRSAHISFFSFFSFSGQ